MLSQARPSGMVSLKMKRFSVLSQCGKECYTPQTTVALMLFLQ